MIATEYREAGLKYLAVAHDSLGEGNVPQASPKPWGAAAEMVKAVAASRGWRHDGHTHLFTVINRLADETGDEEMATLSRAASALHTNFYEQWLPAQDVERAAGEVRHLLQKLDQLLEVPA